MKFKQLLNIKLLVSLFLFLTLPYSYAQAASAAETDFASLGDDIAPLAGELEVPNSENIESKTERDFVDEFVDKYSAAHFNLVISQEMLENAVATQGLAGAYAAQVRHTLDVLVNEQTEEQKAASQKVLFEMASDAALVTKRLFNEYSPEKINRTILGKILYGYIFDERGAGPWHLLLQAIGEYKFSDEEIEKLQLQSHASKRFETGALYFGTPVAVLGGILAVLKGKSVHEITKLFNAGLSKAAKKAKSGLHSTQFGHSAIETFDRVWGQVAESNVLVWRTRLMQVKLLNHLLSREMTETYHNLEYLAVIWGAAGTAGMGYGVLKDIFVNRSFKRSIVNPKPLQTDVYDGLSILHLSCQAYDLLTLTQNTEAMKSKIESEDGLLEVVQKLNSYYARYAMLAKLAPEYLNVVRLSKEIQADPTRGQVIYSQVLKGETIQQNITCEKVRSQAPGPVDVNLAEVLLDLSDALRNLAALQP